MTALDIERWDVVRTPVGDLLIAGDSTVVTRVAFSDPNGHAHPTLPATAGLRGLTDATRVLRTQLDEYFTGTRRSFDVPIRLRGTAFQLAVWNALRLIPFGETRSYGRIAADIGHPRAGRAVGSANNRNPVVIVVPCHRVVSARGAPVGFGGGIDRQEQLLEFEDRTPPTIP